MLDTVVWIFLFLMSVIIHEVAHGYVAGKFGDPTAKWAGRLSLNPLKHIDPFWTVAFPLFLYFSTQGRFIMGMAKPVPVDYRRLKDPKSDMIWVAASGPFTNVLLAFLFSWIWKITGVTVFLMTAYLNLGLAVFNMVPIPPLDGSRVLAGLLPFSLAVRYLKLEPYGIFIVLILYMTGSLMYVVLPGINFFIRLLNLPRIGV